MNYKVLKVLLCSKSIYYTPECECCLDNEKVVRYTLSNDGSPYNTPRKPSGDYFVWRSYSGAYKHLVKHIGIIKAYYIQRLDHETKQLETVDQFDCRIEARKVLKEYLLSDKTAKYYISSRPCKCWN